MSESIVADFVGKFNAEVLTRAEPVAGRVLLSQRRLVLVVDEDNKLTIPLSSIYDVGVGHVPAGLGDFFDSTVTIAFERGGGRHVAAVEAEDEKISKFSTLLFRVILGGAEATVIERACVGGMVTGADFSTATLDISPDAVGFKGPGGSFSIDVASVTGFERAQREVGGSKRPVVRVTHETDDRTITSVVAMGSSRKLSVLARFLRLDYSDRIQDLQDVDLSTEQKRLLVALYADADLPTATLADVVGVEEAAIEESLATLAGDELLRRTDEGRRLTLGGNVVAHRHLPDVDE